MDDLDAIKRLAGVNNPRAPMNQSEVIENMSYTATALKQKERELGIKPGSQEWFDLWFSLPAMQGTSGFRGRRK